MISLLICTYPSDTFEHIPGFCETEILVIASIRVKCKIYNIYMTYLDSFIDGYSGNNSYGILLTRNLKHFYEEIIPLLKLHFAYIRLSRFLASKQFSCTLTF